MEFSLTCSCGTRLRIKAESAGKTVRCPRCGRSNSVAADLPGNPVSRNDPGKSERPRKAWKRWLAVLLLLLLLGGGAVWFYLEPLVETLTAFIDENFRDKPDEDDAPRESRKPPARPEKESPKPLMLPFALERVEASAPGSWKVRLKKKGPDDRKMIYQFRLDPKGEWLPLKDGLLPMANLKPGNMTIEVRGLDAKGNPSQVELLNLLVMPPPTIAIAATEPAIPVADVPLSVQLKGHHPLRKNLNFQYRLGGQANWQSAPAGRFTLAALKAGALKLEARARDDQGNSSDVLARTWTISLPPTVEIAELAPSNPRAGGKLKVHLRGKHPAGKKIQFQYRTGGKGDWQPAEDNGRFTLALLQPGPLHLEVRAVDGKGIPSAIVSRALTVAPPATLTVQIVQATPATPHAGERLVVHLKGAHPEGRKFYYQFRIGSSPLWLEAPEGRIALEDLKAGPLLLQVRIVDDEKKASPLVTRTWNVVPLPTPTVAIVKLEPPLPSAGNNLKVFLQGRHPAGDKLTFHFRTNPLDDWKVAEGGVFTLPALKPGPLRVEVRVRDSKGMSSAVVSRNWLVAFPKPTVEIAGVEPAAPLAGNALSVQLKGTHPAGDKLLFQYRAGPKGDWRSATAGRFTIYDLKPGPLTVEVKAVDEKGLASAVVARTWNIKKLNRPPILRIAKVEPEAPRAGGKLAVQLQATDPDGDALTYQYRIDPKAPWQNAPAGKVLLTGLKAGRLALEARAVDSGGLASGILNRAWTVSSAGAGWMEIARCQGHGDWVLALAFADAKHLVSAGRDKTVRVWSLDGKELRRFNIDHELAAPSAGYVAGNMVLSANGKYAASSSRSSLTSQQEVDTVIRLWDVNAGKQLQRLQGHAAPVTALAFSADGRYLLSASARVNASVFPQKDFNARVWETATGREKHRLEHPDAVRAVALSPSGKFALTDLDDPEEKSIWHWNVSSSREVKHLDGHKTQPTLLAFSPDGSRALSYSPGEKLIYLWDLSGSRKLRHFPAQLASRNLAFSPDGKRCLAGCADNSVRIWDLNNGREMFKLQGHTAPPLWVTFSPDGRMAASASGDKTIRLWGPAK